MLKKYVQDKLPGMRCSGVNAIRGAHNDRQCATDGELLDQSDLTPEAGASMALTPKATLQS